jgi:hypothetical protein
VGRIKAACNLDSTPKSSNSQTSHNSFLHFLNNQIVENLNAMGISLGSNCESISASFNCVKEIELDRLQQVLEEDKINSVFDNEEKEEREKEDVDKLILSSLCNEIVEEVMDLGNAYPRDCKVTPKHKSPSCTKISTKTRSKSKIRV